tara:strand:- start:1159 stop:1452 length:294 start_codon:yes stop_codon:yes gene_type:complete
MKKLLLTLSIVLLSMTAFSQSIEAGPHTRLVDTKDLPIGESFVVLPLDGTVAFSGIISEKTINYMPINTPFILKVTGRDSIKFNIYDKKSLGKSNRK